MVGFYLSKLSKFDEYLYKIQNNKLEDDLYISQ